MTQKAAAVTEITRAIQQFGPEAGPKVVRERYPDVDRSTFWRWCNAAKASAQEQAAALVRRTVPEIAAEVLPVAPAPAIIARSPVTARRNLDFMTKLEALYTDAEMMRQFSVGLNPDGTEKVKVPGFFGQSIKLRSDLLERWIQAYQMLFDFEQMRGFYSTIVEEIGKIDPDTSRRIMERLDEVNRDRGFECCRHDLR